VPNILIPTLTRGLSLTVLSPDTYLTMETMPLLSGVDLTPLTGSSKSAMYRLPQGTTAGVTPLCIWASIPPAAEAYLNLNVNHGQTRRCPSIFLLHRIFEKVESQPP
jgi:hypothetical protein